MGDRQSLTYVEIDVPYCSLTYGEAPCTATLEGENPTGTRKCFNSLGTCQDRANFDDEGVTIRFAIDAAYLPREISCIPCIEKVDYTPGEVSLGVDLGRRASLKIDLVDHPDSDTGPHGDKYRSERSYDPFKQGTFFGKFRVRHPYLRGRALRLIRGYVGQSIEEMETRHFILDSFDGPTRGGRFSLIARDVIKSADGDRAQAPRLSNGFLAANINSSTTSATLSPSGIGNDEYPASGYVAIGGTEICAFTRSGDSLTLTRGQLGTTGVAHSAQDRVQLVLRYESQDPADILADLLINYADVPSSWVPLSAWQDETSEFLQVLYTATIPEPTSVAKLCSELIEQAALAVWPDDKEQTVRLQVLRGISTAASRFDESNTLEGTVDVKDQPDKRVSRVQTYFAQINPLKRVDDPDNYRSSQEDYDEQTETDYGSKAIKRVFSRWIPSGGRSVAQRVNKIQLGRYKVPPRRAIFDVFRNPDDSSAVISLGQGLRLEAQFVQDDTGAEDEVELQVTRLNPMADRYKVEAEEMIFAVADDFNDRTVIFDVSERNVNLRERFDQIYPEPQNGTEVFFIVNAGVAIGSSSTSTFAMDVGDWPDGVTLNLEVNGTVIGCGGRGGGGGDHSENGDNGFPGGPALYLRYPINLFGSGRIAGGGGGGGGGAGVSGYGGGGGGGGAGFNPGAGGAKGNGSFANGNVGAPGSLTAGGDGGGGTQPGRDGAGGGSPGNAGGTGDGGGGLVGGSGGAAGTAIDGDSYITDSETVEVLGSRIN